MSTLKAGAAQTNITPPLGIYLAGSLKARRATDVHDELHAKAMVLDDGKTQLAIVVCDVHLYSAEKRVTRQKALIAERVGDSSRACSDCGNPYTHRPWNEGRVRDKTFR